MVGNCLNRTQPGQTMKLLRWTALAVMLTPVLLSASALADEERFIQVGTTSKGYPMFVDQESINGGKFDIAVSLPSGGMQTYKLQAACSARRLQVIQVSTYAADGQELSRSNARSTMPTYNANTVGGKALQVVCRKIGVAGF